MNSYHKKLKKIASSIQKEGTKDYLFRLYSLGMYRRWAKKILNKKCLTSKTATVHGQQMQLPSRKGGLVEEILLYGTHEPIATSVYESYLKPGMNVLEVGTNIGYYLIVADKKIGKEGRIVGFEPDLEAYDCANQNIQSLQSKVKIHNIAASDSDGEATFYQSELSNWGSLIHHEDLKSISSLTVKTTSIDNFCKTEGFSPDVIRMDIEGAEISALKGAIETLATHKPLLFIEFHKFMMLPNEVDAFLDTLKANGYENFSLINRYYDFPWTLPEAQKRSLSQVSFSELTSYANNPESPQVFSIITQHPEKSKALQPEASLVAA